MRKLKVLIAAFSAILVIGCLSVTVYNIHQSQNERVELTLSKDYFDEQINNLLESLANNKNKIQKMRNQINQLLTNTPSPYNVDLKKLDGQLMTYNHQLDVIKKETLSYRPQVDALKSTAQVPKWYKVLDAENGRLEGPSIKIGNLEDQFNATADSVNEVGKDREFNHYMKHYDDMNRLKEKLQLMASADDKGMAELRRALYEKGLTYRQLNPVSWTFYAQLHTYHDTNYKVVKEAYDQLQNLSTQENDQAYATQLTQVNKLADTYISQRATYVKKEIASLLAKY